MPSFDDSTFSFGGKQERDACIPLFRYEAMLDNEASEASGKKIYKDVPFVEILAPGNKLERVIRPVQDCDKIRWPESWKKFSESGKGGIEDIDGTPIAEWAQATAGQVKTLKSSEVHTVEQFAELPDVYLQGMGSGMTDLRNKARVYVQSQRGEISVQKVSAENRKLKSQVKDLESTIEKMHHRLEVLEGKEK
jgi:hypothetical protein